MKEIKIGNVNISQYYKPFIIAEMSGNHNQSLERALEIVDAAAISGAHAIKLQTYTPDTLTIDANNDLFFINDNQSLWKGQTLYQLYKQAYTPWEWHKPIFERAKQKGLIFFSSPFDETAVDFLESLNVPAYKVASFENNHHPLLKKIAKTAKPVIMSTGLTNISNLDESVRVLREAGCKDLILLKCTSTYPASPENTNINSIPHLSQLFNCPVGLSDHTMGIGVSLAAIAMGACIIEKHFTLKRADGGVDSVFSLEPEELKSLVVESERAFLSLGNIQYGIQKAEEQSVQFKRSIYVVKDIDAGEAITSDNIRIIRPGDGLEPKYYDTIIRHTIKIKVKKGTPLRWEHLL